MVLKLTGAAFSASQGLPVANRERPLILFIMSGPFYETDDLLNQYLLFHYGSAEERMPWSFGPRIEQPFPVSCVERGLDPSRLKANPTGLDVGCAVGRSTFEMARYLDAVTGIDYSDSFVMAARLICREKSLPFTLAETGTIQSHGIARIPDVYCSRVHFEQGDAHALRRGLGPVDVLLAANLLCRLADPRAFLGQLPDLLKSGGQLILTTPNTWLQDFTAKKYWLGATPDTGEPLEAIQRELGANFDLVHCEDLPFVIREHRRKYQWSVAQLTRWIRK